MDRQLLEPSRALARTFALPDDQLGELLPRPAEDVVRSLHGFRVGNIGLLLPEETVCELFHELAYCRLPNTSAALVGMANVRGDIIPLLDLNHLFGIPASEGVRWRFLVVGTGEKALGIRIEGVPTRLNLSAENKLKILPPLPEPIRPHVRACYRLDGIWVDWDIFAAARECAAQMRRAS